MQRRGKYTVRYWRPRLNAARRLRRRRYNYPDLREETKFLDVGMSETALSSSTTAASLELMPTAGCTNCISVPATGDDASSRDGKKYIMKSIQVKGYIRLPRVDDPSLAAPTAVTGWLAMVLDTQTNGLAVNSEDVFKQIVANAHQLPFRNLTFAGKRFRILRFFKWNVQDRQFTMLGTHTYIQEEIVRFKFYKKLNMIVNCYSNTSTADVASVTDNSISIIGATNLSAAGPLCAYSARLRFRG